MKKVNNKGSYSVEFSLLFPLVMCTLVFFIELSHYHYTRTISTQAVIATCGADYVVSIEEALPHCWECYAGVSEDDSYYYCEFYDEVEPIVGLIPDAMRPIELRISTLAPKIEELRELIERLEDHLQETGL